MAFFGLRRKILLALIATTVVFAAAMIGFAHTVVRGQLVEKLQEKGVAIARKVAADSVNHVITGRLFEVAMMFKDLEDAEDDFVYGFVVDEEGRELVHTFAGSLPAALRQANPVDPRASHAVRQILTDRGAVLDVGVPLLHGQAGALHLGISLDAIRKDVNRIVLLITIFALCSILLGGLLAVGISRFVTAPLLKLAAAATSFGRSEAHPPVSVLAEDEVGELARVFNEMVENRRRAEAERERLIVELRQALGEVKTLRGFLPICSSCKKIRGDEGYWQQIESYLREHTGAEFSHGLCPECAKSLYPDYWDKIRDATTREPRSPPET